MFEFYLRDHGLLFPNGIAEEFVQFLGMHQEITSEPHVVTPARRCSFADARSMSLLRSVHPVRCGQYSPSERMTGIRKLAH
jgi:hypothetical protein